MSSNKGGRKNGSLSGRHGEDDDEGNANGNNNNGEDSRLTILRDLDVLMGRGASITKRPGNIHFLQLVDQHRGAYAAAPKREKMLISKQIISLIEDKGGRFVKMLHNNPNACLLISHQRAVEKTSQALREIPKYAQVAAAAAAAAAAGGRGGANNSTTTETSSVVPKEKSKKSFSSTFNNDNPITSLVGSNSNTMASPPISSHKKRPHYSHKESYKDEDEEGDEERMSSTTPSKYRMSPDDTDEDENDDESSHRSAMEEEVNNEETRKHNKKQSSKKKSSSSSGSSSIHHNNNHNNDHHHRYNEDDVYDKKNDDPDIHEADVGDERDESDSDVVDTVWRPYRFVSSWGSGGSSNKNENKNGRNGGGNHKSINDDDKLMLQELRVFRQTFGHTAVPANWTGNPPLAAWVGRQRQLHRELISGYSIERPQEHIQQEENLRKLLNKEFDFSWDYEEWHWYQNYQDLIRALDGKRYDDPSRQNNVRFSEDLQLWVDEQRRQHCEHTLLKARMESLISLGILDPKIARRTTTTTTATTSASIKPASIKKKAKNNILI